MILRAALIAMCAGGTASALELEIPVDCEIGTDCYVQSYADRDPGPGATDYTCNPMSYDGHKGTDFRVLTFSDMRAGVDILAAASGVVKGVRDGEPDAGKDGMTSGRDCGNGLVIDHGDGWVTQYCHMAMGSLAVIAGQTVSAGEMLGRMGFSGRTEFPHLHFSVRKDGKPVDPFDARANSESCSLADDASLWSPTAHAKLPYIPGGAVDAGFAPSAPTLADVRLGNMFAPPNGTSPILAFWARFHNVRKGDVIRIRLKRPNGAVFAKKDVPMTRNRAEYFHFVGGRLPKQGWPSGAYHGQALLIRGGQTVDHISATTTIK